MQIYCFLNTLLRYFFVAHLCENHTALPSYVYPYNVSFCWNKKYIETNENHISPSQKRKCLAQQWFDPIRDTLDETTYIVLFQFWRVVDSSINPAHLVQSTSVLVWRCVCWSHQPVTHTHRTPCITLCSATVCTTCTASIVLQLSPDTSRWLSDQMIPVSVTVFR